jgi:chondroitin 4-sulfotransferase 11
VVIGSVLLAGLHNSDEDPRIRCVEAERKKVRRRYDSKYIVHDERKFVYFVIQKVACTSVKAALLPLFGDLDAERFENARPDGSVLVRVHKLFDGSRYQLNREEMLSGEYRDYFKFAFVRNPWDRLVSCYLEKFARPNSPGLKAPPDMDVELYAGMPFAGFVEAVSVIPDQKANPHFRSQHIVVCGPEGRVMADFVGRFENLHEDFARVAGEIGAPELNLPHRLKTRNRETRPYADFYDERLKRLVGERNERDIETFRYSYYKPVASRPAGFSSL